MNQRDGHGTDILIEQPLALRSYLEALLEAVPEATEESAEIEPAAAPVAAPPAAQPTELRREAGQPAPPAVVSDRGARPKVPEWAAEAFQCLVFKVAGLALAVPLAKLNGVIPWTAASPMPNRSPMFLGLLQHQGRHVKVVDTGLVVMPERAAPLNPADREDGAGNIILIDDGRWGLVCDSVGEVLTLRASDVRWRSDRGRRPWLAGTVLQHLCAVLDTDALAHLLATGERQGGGRS